MTEPSNPRRRAGVLAAILAVVVAFLVATDDGELATTGRCLIAGQGRAYVPAEPQDFAGDFLGMKYEGKTDNLIDIHVFAYGGYEVPVLYAMRDELVKRSGEGKGVVLDVGANVGTHTIFMSKHAKKVIAVEPWPTILIRLHKHLELNNIKNVVIRTVGYSASTGEMPFHVPPGFNQGWGSFSNTFSEIKYSDESDVIQLPLVKGDDDLKKAGIDRVDLIKIDIEGFEKPAFEGLAETLKRDRPAAFFELNVTNDEGFKSEKQLRETFPENYEFWEIRTRKEMLWRSPGGGLLMCGLSEGYYELVPFNMDFSEDGKNLIAKPK